MKNTLWIIGRCALVDVSTATHPRAVAMVDAADLPLISDPARRWFAADYSGNTLYASRSGGHKQTHQRLHHVLAGKPPRGMVIDHINGDGLDNRRRNLRPATRRMNVVNQRPRRRCSSRYRGVCAHADGSWTAGITVNRRRIYLGIFKDEAAAAAAYDAAARAHFGPFARPNFQE